MRHLLLLLAALMQPATIGAFSRARPAVLASRHMCVARHGLRCVHHAESPQGVYFIMGGPGSGKGTQCERLAETYKLTHLSAGDLLRQEVRSGSPRGKEIAEIIAEGKIVRSETTVGLLQSAMEESEGPYLIDGFPRSLENLVAFTEQLGLPTFMLFLEVTEEEMLKRLLKRGISSGRSDDNRETITKRFRTYVEESMPVVQALQQKGLVRHVAAQASTDEVFERVRDCFADQQLVPCVPKSAGRLPTLLNRLSPVALLNRLSKQPN